MIRRAIGALLLCLGGLGSLAHAAPALEDYARSPAIELVKLSPSGGQYAMVKTSNGDQRLVVTPTDGGPSNAVDLGKLRICDIAWAGEDHMVITTTTLASLGPGFAESRAWMIGASVLNLKTRHMFRVFAMNDSVAGGMIEGSYGVRLIGGRWYGFFGGFNEERMKAGVATSRDLYKVDLDTGAVAVVSKGSDHEDNWLVGPSGDVVARYLYFWDTGKWQVLAGAAGYKVLASGHSKFGAGGDLYLGRTDDEILFARPADDEGQVVLETIPLAGGPAVETPDVACGKCVLLDAATQRWIGTLNDADKPQVRLFDVGLDARVHSIFDAFPDRTPELRSWDGAFDRIILYTSGGPDSGTYQLVDLTQGKVQPIGVAYPTIAPADVGPTKVIDYRAGDGLQLHGVLTVPPGKEPKGLPLVVVANPRPGSRAHPAFDASVQALASRGYAVFQPNARGASGYGEDFFKAGFGQVGDKAQTDISDGVAELDRQGVIDRRRVCILGADWGGYAALAGVTVQRGVYRCAVAEDGYSDLNDAVRQSKANTAQDNNVTRYLRALIGPRWGSDAGIRAISPISNAAQADGPILIFYHRDDPASSRQQAEAMADALRRAGRPVELMAQSADVDEPATEANNIAQVQAIVDFLQKYNTPDARPASVTTN